MRSMLKVLAMAIGMSLLVSGIAVADTVSTNFEAFTPGTVNLQDGWKSATLTDNPAALPNGYDQEVVANAGAPAAFGAKSLRISNAWAPPKTSAPPEFELQTYSKPTTDPAGEGETNTVYTAQFSFISFHPDREQPSLKISVSPDNGHGARMSYIGLTDMADGIHVSFYDTADPNGDFEFHDLGTLPRNVPHTIRFWMRLVPGPDNDLVRISIDGKDAGQCFTTWENYYREQEKHEPAPSDRLLFLVGNRDGNILSLLGGGYLFDNVTTTTAPGEGPPTCDLEIDKRADDRTVSAGGRAGYQITVRNRGSATARNLRVCDHIPRRTTFVSSDRKLSRVGRQRCLAVPRLAPGQRVSFHVVLGVDADAPPGTLANFADVTPGTPGSPATPGSPVKPATDLPPRARVVRAAAIVKARAVVRVRARQSTRPGVTG